MTEADQRAAIAKDIVLGDQAIRAARLLHDSQLYSDALNRAFYAVFHYATALLLSEGVEPKRHRAIVGLLGKHCEAVLSATDRAVYGRLTSHRELADYERWFNPTQEVAEHAIADAQAWIEKVKTHLVDTGWA